MTRIGEWKGEGVQINTFVAESPIVLEVDGYPFALNPGMRFKILCRNEDSATLAKQLREWADLVAPESDRERFVTLFNRVGAEFRSMGRLEGVLEVSNKHEVYELSGAYAGAYFAFDESGCLLAVEVST